MKPHFTNTDTPIDFPKTMNQRIRELAEQAAESSSWKPGLGNEHVQKYFQEFAELIVRECAEQVKNLHVNDYGISGAEIIREHFGVDK